MIEDTSSCYFCLQRLSILNPYKVRSFIKQKLPSAQYTVLYCAAYCLNAV